MLAPGHDCLVDNRSNYSALFQKLIQKSLLPKSRSITLILGSSARRDLNYRGIAELLLCCSDNFLSIEIDICLILHGINITKLLNDPYVHFRAAGVTSLALSPVDASVKFFNILRWFTLVEYLHILWRPSIGKDWQKELLGVTCSLPSVRRFQVEMGQEELFLLTIFRLPRVDEIHVFYHMLGEGTRLNVQSAVGPLLPICDRVRWTFAPFLSTFGFAQRLRFHINSTRRRA
jgi:hypothetical protein